MPCEGGGLAISGKTGIGKRGKALLPKKEGPRRGLFFAASKGEASPSVGSERADGPDAQPRAEGLWAETGERQVVASRQVSTARF